MIPRRTLLSLPAAALLAGSASPAVEALPPALSFGREATDVIVVGGGGAGLSAAAAAAEAGCRVTLLERMPAVGGNTRVSGGFFAAVDPRRQARIGVRDDVDFFARQIVENGAPDVDPALARVLARGASRMLALLEREGMRFRDDVIELYGSHWPRCHMPILPNGEGYVRTLLSIARRKGVRIRTRAHATELLIRSGRVAGVLFEENGEARELLAGRGVILASGGFGANPSLVERFAPELAGLTNDNTPGSMGEMLLEARKAGAELIGLGEIQCLPGCPPGRTRRVRLHNDVSRFIFVDRTGRRFVREDARRDVLRDTILALPGRLAYSVIDDVCLRSYDILMQKEAVLGVETGDAWRGDTVEELARAMGVPPEALRATIDEYNRGVLERHDRFDKAPAELLHEIRTPPFWACFAAMTVHYTMGGVRINERAQALRSDGSAVPGLWAAGEVAGGVHGVNRMGANGINDALVFGRIAGRSAAGLPADL